MKVVGYSGGQRIDKPTGANVTGDAGGRSRAGGRVLTFGIHQHLFILVTKKVWGEKNGI